MASDGNARCTSGQRPGRGCLVGAPMEGDIFCEATHDAHRASSRALRSSAPSALSSRLGGETRHSSRRLRTQIFSSSKSSQANCRLTGGARSKALCGFSAPIAPSCSSRESPSPKSSCSASLTPFAAAGKKQNGMHDFQRVDKRSGRTASDKSFCAIGYSQKPQSQAAAVLVCQVGRLRDFHPLETKSFADTPLERTGFELVWGFPCQVVFFGLLPVLCSERGGAFFVPSPGDQVPGARGRGQGTETLGKLGGVPPSGARVWQRLDA